MQHPTLQLLVTRGDESVARGNGGSHIPTIGHAASYFDAYRTVAVDHVVDKPKSWCITDTDAAGALGRLIDGPIQSCQDIERAESALRTILLHDYVEILVPCLKAEHNSQLVSYIRLDKDQRNDAAFAAFNEVPCRDLLFATEYLSIANGIVSSSSNLQSKAVNKSVELLAENYRNSLADASETASALPFAVGAATFYTSPELTSVVKRGSAGFIDELYSRVYRPWAEVAQAAPTLQFQATLPPLAAIVLSRASSRSHIPQVIRELRDELTTARSELHQLNESLTKIATQADINYFSRRINESFDAIVPEALLTDSERTKRTILTVFSFLKPVRQLYSVAMDPISVNRERLEEIFASTSSAVASNSRIISRSVAAERFANLLRVESLRNTIESHFSKDEIWLLQDSSGAGQSS